MQTTLSNRNRRLDSGQTLVIALLIVGVLLILGIAFTAIINQNISATGRSAKRTVANDLAEAGSKYAHSQLLSAALGADWRPQATPVAFDVAGFTKDPDALYLRPATGFQVEPDPAGRPGYFVTDLGGPDYLGPYSRIGFTKGRALIRVRYSPSAYDSYGISTGTLREPGAARGFIVIESVGRSGPLDNTGRIDPSELLARSVQVALFADQNATRAGLGVLKSVDSNISNSRKLIAFASIGIVETARYVTNLNNVSRPAELGMPSLPAAPTSWQDTASLGVGYEGQIPTVVNQWGQNPSGAASVPVDNSKWDQLPGLGSLWVNGELKLYGQNDVFCNTELGEGWFVTRGIKPANTSTGALLSLFELDPAGANWVAWANPAKPYNSPVNLGSGQLDSSNPNFLSIGSVLRDGNSAVDELGYTRAAKTKEAPSITATNPQSGLNRYRELSQRSGAISASGELLGAYGYGEGVYVNSAERGNRTTAEQRTTLDPSKSLPNDWGNPNNVGSRGWQGQFYIPMAAAVQFLPDGFVVTRDSRSGERFWRDPATGASTGNASCRFWIRTVGGVTYIVNSILNPAFDPLTGNFAAAGQEFNGVLLFEGDVRVRGVIPTDQQVSVVSLGTIYIDGSVVKGVFDPWSGTTLTRPSKSLLALMAKDHVALNTTMFFAPALGQSPRPKSGDPLPNTPNPIELDQAESPDITMTAQFLLNPTGNNPQLWTSFAEQYVPAMGLGAPGPISSSLLLTSSADDNGPAFVSMDVSTGTFNDGTPSSTVFGFPAGVTFGLGAFTSYVVTNAAAPFFGGTNIPVYGLGDPAVNSYPKFETVAASVFNSANAGFWNGYSAVSRKLTATNTNPEGQYELSVQDPTFFRLRLTSVGTTASKNFLAAKVAVAPFDVRIEAVIYAQNGSFYVIPGNWFNMNSDDTRLAFETNYTPGDITDDLDTTAMDYNPAQTMLLGGNNVSRLTVAQQRRFDRYGNTPEVPFYQEPLDVRISIVGALSENMPPPMSVQAEWLKKWGWIPQRLGGSGKVIPAQHLPTGLAIGTRGDVVPNLTVVYDPVLATAAVPSTAAVNSPLEAVRTDADGNILPPAPRLPVSPTLAYFGDATP